MAIDVVSSNAIRVVRQSHTVRSVILCERVTAVTAKPAVLKPAITRADRFNACTASSQPVSSAVDLLDISCNADGQF